MPTTLPSVSYVSKALPPIRFSGRETFPDSSNAQPQDEASRRSLPSLPERPGTLEVTAFLKRLKLTTVEDIQEALENINPQAAENWLFSARIFQDAEKPYYPLAKEIYKALIRTPSLSPQQEARAHIALGDLYKHQGQMKQALKHLNQAVAILPDDDPLRMKALKEAGWATLYSEAPGKRNRPKKSWRA